eukprot:TRINITY_DN107518_c0_g1_i1.p1 TRINITY_DN107518_c0_g1~~TRINITY_DN107518_c0_g1_i1.p1  ORF type:complete len:423 (+),score=36.34 TRINITY_DN107518_c0_g1_i1:92-1270(+)
MMLPGNFNRARKVTGLDLDARVMILMGQLISQILRLEYKPPVTLGLIAVNVAAWLRMGPFSVLQYGLGPMLCPSQIVRGQRPWTHVFLSSFTHAPDGGFHLVYNMLSLLWKGVALEATLGSAHFAALVGMLLFLSHALFVPVSYMATVLFGAGTYYSCAVGFSAVLFGLKVIAHHSIMGQQALHFWGLPFAVQSKYAAWVELVLISVLSPNASFVGHLCGILAGMICLQIEGLIVHTRRQRVVSRLGANVHPAHLGGMRVQNGILRPAYPRIVRMHDIGRSAPHHSIAEEQRPSQMQHVPLAPGGRSHSPEVVRSVEVSQDIVRQLPVHKVTEHDLSVLSGDRRSCSICLDEFQEGDLQRTLPCFHMFHVHCVDRWLDTNVACPVCKYEVVH